MFAIGLGAQVQTRSTSDGMPYGPTNSITNQRIAATTAAANAAAAAGIRIHTVTLDRDPGDMPYGTSGADYAYMASLVRNGGRASERARAAK